ncbi:hypothetical protein LCGC14_2625610 [marine sediment metagenome]|uniref:Uncharacterized protein n=1 Tax=marine sediment metagenome TaxID=412755 RepID=A0A0F9CU96_9ZZZZ
MKVYNTKGELITNIQLDAQDERAGEDVVFVIDMESKGIQKKILKRLEGIEKELRKINS